jgi:hypothetical protein
MSVAVISRSSEDARRMAANRTETQLPEVGPDFSELKPTQGKNP